jgi:hypothetical protein
VDKQEDPATAAAWNYPVTGQPAEWPWQSLSNPLNPEPTPPAPKGGLQVTLSTGPDGMWSSDYCMVISDIQLCVHIGSMSRGISK